MNSVHQKITLPPINKRICFVYLEIPEWLQVYAKASPDLDDLLKVFLHIFITLGTVDRIIIYLLIDSDMFDI